MDQQDSTNACFINCTPIGAAPFQISKQLINRGLIVEIGKQAVNASKHDFPKINQDLLKLKVKDFP